MNHDENARKRGALEQRAYGDLGAAQAGALHPPPVDEHAFDGPQRSHQIRGLVVGVAGPAPGADVSTGRHAAGVLYAGDLRGVPAALSRQVAPGRPGVAAELDETIREDLPGLLDSGVGRRGHGG